MHRGLKNVEAPKRIGKALIHPVFESEQFLLKSGVEELPRVGRIVRLQCKRVVEGIAAYLRVLETFLWLPPGMSEPRR